MRTKEEILDTIDGLGGHLFREERTANIGKGVGDVAPGAALVEAMKPFAEAVLDLRDLLVPIVGPDAQVRLSSLFDSFAKTKVAEQSWRQEALGLILDALGVPGLRNLREAKAKAQQETKDDADADPEAAPGHGRTDSDPEEAGSGA